MTTKVANKRRSRRVPAVHPVTVMDDDGYVITTGRTCDASECGVLVIADSDWDPAPDSEVVVELRVPTSPTARKPNRLRSVTYRARVVRVRGNGSMVGVGMELIQKMR